MLEERAATLAADLGADEAAVREDLENLVSYSVPIDEAERSLRRKYGGDVADGSPAEMTNIGEITVSQERASVTAVVIGAGKRPIRYEGEERVIVEGELADETGRIGYTAWEDFGLAPGTTVRIENASVREWDENPELNLGAATTVSVADTSLAVDVAIDEPATLGSLEPGDRDVTVEGAVVEVEERTIDGRDGKREIRSGVIGDASARLPFTDWEARDRLRDGASLRIENAYVREFRGVPTLNLSRFTEIMELEDDIEVIDAGVASSISDAIRSGPGLDVVLTGSIVTLREGSGLIDRCPECHRPTRQGRCRTHGEVNGEPDLRVRGVLDDGTATATVILDRELTESVYEGSVEDAVDAAREAMDQSIVTEELRSRLVGRMWQVTGRLSIDEFGATIDATTFEPVPEEPAELAADTLASLEGRQ